MANVKSNPANVRSGSQDDRGENREITPIGDVINYAKAYAKEKPEMAALWQGDCAILGNLQESGNGVSGRMMTW